MEQEQVFLSLSQANRMKRMSQSGKMDMLYENLGEEKPNQWEELKIYADTLEGYSPSDFTPKPKVELIEKLVKE